MQQGIIDSHAHICGNVLFPRFRRVTADAEAAGVARILIVCTEVEEARRALEIAKNDGRFDVAAGFYPNDVGRVTRKDWDELERLVADDGICAVGEIGMDYFSGEVPAQLQKEALIRQIGWANRLLKPILVHMRLATADTEAILREHLKVPGIMHCYSGGYDAMGAFLDMGMYLSFSGNITFENDEQTFKAVRNVPLDRILVETDAPSLTPGPVQPLDNEPKYIRYVIQKICELRNMEEAELIAATRANYERLFSEMAARRAAK